MPPCVFKACRKHCLLPAFSLIELLVVMAILFSLAGIAANGISHSSQNPRLTSRDLVKAKLQQARAHAMANHTYTAMVVPVRSSGKNGLHEISIIEVERMNEGYVPVENENGDTVMLQKWTKLSGNFHFVTNSMIGSDLPTVVDEDETLTLLQKGRVTECHAIVFAPNGQIRWPSAGSPIHIAIAEAAHRGGSFRITRISNHRPVFDLLVVNRLTAKTRNVTP